ncbi:tetratricopeptide repeat protein [Spirochaeta dissipatitropha]
MKIYRNVMLILLILIYCISCASIAEESEGPVEPVEVIDTIGPADSVHLPPEIDPDIIVRQRSSNAMSDEQTPVLMLPEVPVQPAEILDRLVVQQSWSDIPLKVPEPPEATVRPVEIPEPADTAISDPPSPSITSATPTSEAAAVPGQVTQTPAADRNTGSRITPLHDSPPDISDRKAEITQSSAVNQPFIVLLPGDAWIYIGEESGNPDISFRSRSSDDGDTVFRFIAETTGDYLLVFQRQDLQKGLTERKLAEITVLRALPPGEETASTATADTISEQENQTDAGLLSGNEPDDNTTENYIFQDMASALAEGDSSTIRETINKQYLLPESGRNLLDDIDALSSAAEILRSSYDPGDSITARTLSALNEISALGPEGLFWLGQHYESVGVRDYQQSVRFYEQLIRQYPYHQLAEQAGVRSRFIRRHFLDIL